MSDAVIQDLQVIDLKEVTRIHLEAFPKSALGQLGKGAVTRYYQWQLQGPHDAVALGIYRGANLAGFCFGGVFRGALSGFLRKNRSFLVWQVLIHPWLVTNPLFLERLNLAWAVLARRPAPVVSLNVSRKKSFGILSIAVDPQLQGGGYGRQLMLNAERIALERGFVDMHLTVAVDNDQAITFYERLGWKKLLASDGIWHGPMVKHLDRVSE